METTKFQHLFDVYTLYLLKQSNIVGSHVTNRWIYTPANSARDKVCRPRCSWALRQCLAERSCCSRAEPLSVAVGRLASATHVILASPLSWQRSPSDRLPGYCMTSCRASFPIRRRLITSTAAVDTRNILLETSHALFAEMYLSRKR